MGTPAAYFLTWTTRGAWLHGDPRGSVDSDHNGYRRPLLREDHWRAAREWARVDGALSLGSDAREVVEAAFDRVCDRRAWALKAQGVRTQHVHVVVAAPHHDPERVMQQLKAWATRDLRGTGLAGPNERVWTRHGSTKYLWTDEQLERAMHYVLNEQDNRHRFVKRSEPRA